MIEPSWLMRARAELDVAEVRGTEHNDRIVEYFKLAGHPEIDDDETAWCSAFACAVFEMEGVKSPKTLWARDWLKWGTDVTDDPLPGDVVVLKRGDGGHVGLFLGYNDDRTMVRLLGGNQRDKVCEAWFDVRNVLGIRAPLPEHMPKPPTNDNPVLTTTVKPIPVLPPFETREAVQDRLRENGSRTLANVDAGTTAAKVGGGAVLGLEVLRQTADWWREFMPAVGDILKGVTWAADYKAVFLAVILILVTYNLYRIRDARIDDDMNGLHIGRKG